VRTEGPLSFHASPPFPSSLGEEVAATRPCGQNLWFAQALAGPFQRMPSHGRLPRVTRTAEKLPATGLARPRPWIEMRQLQGGKSKIHYDGTTSGWERTRPIYFRLLGGMQTRTGCDTGVFLLQRNSRSRPL
jgi:hypothetical protein